MVGGGVSRGRWQLAGNEAGNEALESQQLSSPSGTPGERVSELPLSGGVRTFSARDPPRPAPRLPKARRLRGLFSTFCFFLFSIHITISGEDGGGFHPLRKRSRIYGPLHTSVTGSRAKNPFIIPRFAPVYYGRCGFAMGSHIMTHESLVYF